MTRDRLPTFAPPGRTLLSAAVMTAFVTWPAAPNAADAADSQLQPSSDGVNYAASLPAPVFGPITGLHARIDFLGGHLGAQRLTRQRLPLHSRARE